jgi:hypothetical protein
MEDILIALLQCVVEFLADVFCYGPFDWPFSEKAPGSLVSKCTILFFVGSSLAWISVLVLKHTWISFSALRIANLFLAPITSAFISQAIARYRGRRNRSIVPRNHFWQAFWFTLGVVTIRFAYAVRN